MVFPVALALRRSASAHLIRRAPVGGKTSINHGKGNTEL